MTDNAKTTATESAEPTVQHAKNVLIATAVAYRDAVRHGQGSSAQQEWDHAVDAYVKARGPVDAERDRLLAENPAATPSELGEKAMAAFTGAVGAFVAALSAKKRR